MNGYGFYCHEDGSWSIFRNDPGTEDLQWWCGWRGWVSPNSDYWELMPDCWAECFSSFSKAKQTLKEAVK